MKIGRHLLQTHPDNTLWGVLWQEQRENPFVEKCGASRYLSPAGTVYKQQRINTTHHGNSGPGS
jgi:hypothetical protein